MKTIKVYFSLGSNIGDKRQNILMAIQMLEEAFAVKAGAVSNIIETLPWGFTADENFMNAAVCFCLPSVGQNPLLYSMAILRICKEIEHKMGREEHDLFTQSGKRQYFSRIIDIDILFYGDYKISTPILTIPHPLINERDFVLIPLKQIYK